MAVNYPPSGLPLLFAGEEGTGKSLLAKLSYEYAVDQGVIQSEDCKFRLFSCRSYVNEPRQAEKILFGDENNRGLLGAENSDMIYFKDINCLSRGAAGSNCYAYGGQKDILFYGIVQL